jgi:hypothetical protein
MVDRVVDAGLSGAIGVTGLFIVGCLVALIIYGVRWLATRAVSKLNLELQKRIGEIEPADVGLGLLLVGALSWGAWSYFGV